MFDDLLKLIKNSPRWAHSSLARRLGLSFSYGHPDDDFELDPVEETDWTKLQVSGTKPPVRSGHSSVVVNGVMYVFGGYNEGNCHNDLYAFNLVHHHWTKLEHKGGIVPDGRASHAWCASTDQTKLYLFGGSGPHWGQTNMGKLLQYCLVTHEWSVVPTSGTHPPPGYGQSLVAIDNKLYLFGGTSGHIYVNDMYVFDELQHTWTCMVTHGPKPSPRYKHQAVVVGSAMYIIGGGLYDPPKGNIDMFKYDTLTATWSPVTCQGDIPRSRIAHTVSFFAPTASSPRFIMFGGRDESGIRMNELCQFDVDSSTWSRLEDDTNAPDARDFHTSTVWGSSIFVFGGSNGEERNSDVFRFAMQYDPPSLTVLAIQAVQEYLRTNRALQRQYQDVCLPRELQMAIESLNANVRATTNDEWYPLPVVETRSNNVFCN
ncbi:Kelch domain-containing protein 10 [Aphanomyces cochlioides]|nr:Kelch domain-containing protein 10 [Aphanomyces cochlioides]